jgi:hypothetical protein
MKKAVIKARMKELDKMLESNPLNGRARMEWNDLNYLLECKKMAKIVRRSGIIIDDMESVQYCCRD